MGKIAQAFVLSGLSGLLCSHHPVPSFWDWTTPPGNAGHGGVVLSGESSPRSAWEQGADVSGGGLGGHKKPGIESNPAIGLPAPVSCGLALVCRETVFVPPTRFGKQIAPQCQCQWPMLMPMPMTKKANGVHARNGLSHHPTINPHPACRGPTRSGCGCVAAPVKKIPIRDLVCG